MMNGAAPVSNRAWLFAQSQSAGVELAHGVSSSQEIADKAADAVLTILRRLNSEFANYVPLDLQRPTVTLYPQGHPDYFPVGVKHRYSR
jgi:phenylacetate-CoA ligase